MSSAALKLSLGSRRRAAVGLLALSVAAIVGWLSLSDSGVAQADADTVPDNHSFETPSLDPGTFAYSPTAPGWTFEAAAGLSTNNSPFTQANPPAPNGQQVLFVQGSGVATQTVDLQGGPHQMSVWIAQRGSRNTATQTVRFRVDDLVVADLTPAGPDYEHHTLDLPSLEPGMHVLRVEGVNPAGGDNTAFIDALTIEPTVAELAPGPWNNPETWGGSIPGPGTSVTIPAGADIVIDGHIEVDVLVVNGTLRCGDGSTSLTAREIMVHGRLQCGTPELPHLDDFEIVLTGPPSADPAAGHGTKALVVMPGGTVDLHGAPETSWTRLDATAEPGGQGLVVDGAVTWEAGDQLVVTSTDFDPFQAERVTVSAVDGQTIVLDQPLANRHWGETVTSGGHILDERAEVGLLSRNITIRGDAGSHDSGFGGHVMSMQGAIARISGVELNAMGQKGVLARYPIHWHLAGDADGQYIRDSSIHRSFNRCVTVHGTDNVVVADNVCFDHIGHGFFLEDGDERGNRFERNLGVLTRAPTPGEEVRPHDRVTDESGAFLQLPATFWIANPDNHFVGNVAAGSEGSGFWMVALNQPSGGDNQSMVPGRFPLAEFVDNAAHSNNFSNLAIDGDVDPATHQLVFGRYEPKVDPWNPNSAGARVLVDGFTAHHSRDRSLWFRAADVTVRNSASGDNHRATFFSFNQTLENSLVIGRSPNIGMPTSPQELAAGRSLPRPNGIETMYRGHSIYDGPSNLVNVHFAAFRRGDAAIQTNGAAYKSPVHTASGVTFQGDVAEASRIDFGPLVERGTMFSSGLVDLDGSITGVAGSRIVPDLAAASVADDERHDPTFNQFGSCTPRPAWRAHVCTGTDQATYRLVPAWDGGQGSPAYLRRDDTGATVVDEFGQVDKFLLFPVSPGSDALVDVTYVDLPNRSRHMIRFLTPGATTVTAMSNVPSSTVALLDGQPLPSFDDAASLTAAGTSGFAVVDNTLLLQLVADQTDNAPRWGYLYPHRTPEVTVCLEASCSDPKGTTAPTIADFETGPDSRDSLSGDGDLKVGAIGWAWDRKGGPFDDGEDDIVYWDVRSDGDGVDECLDYRLDLDGQVWTRHDALEISTKGPKVVELLVEDTDAGLTSLGLTDPGPGARTLDLPSDPALVDDVTGVVVRHCESHFTGLDKAGARSRVHLEHIALVPTSNRLPVATVAPNPWTSISGWAFDPDVPTAQLDIVVTIDGQIIFEGPTNQFRGDVNQVHGITGVHGFNVPIPPQFRGPTLRTVRVTVTDANDSTRTRVADTTRRFAFTN